MAYLTIDAQRMDYVRRGLEEGRRQGIEEGREEEKQNLLYELVQDGILSLSAAADKANQTEETFKAGMDTWLAESGAAFDAGGRNA